jgi:hypothetical protein
VARTKATPAGTPAAHQLVASILENYATRAVFRGFSQGPVSNGRTTFKMLWHRDRFFELVLDVPRKTLRFPAVLPEVPAGSTMYREFREFVESRQSHALPEHRRIDKEKADVRCGNQGGDVSVTLTTRDGDFEYGVRKLINLVHETYLVFLFDGRYHDYLVETFNLDPDRM